MNIGERLKAARKARGYTQQQVASAVGVSRVSITQWETGDTKQARPDNLLRACRFLGVDVDDMVFGHGPIKSAPPPDNEESDIVIDQYHEVSGAMGHGLLLRDQPGQITGWRVTREWISKNVPCNTGSSNLRIVTGFGDSMRGMFNSGDPLLVDTGVRSVEFDAVYFFRVGDEGFIKRLQRIPGDGIRVISKNPDYETWTIREGMDFEVFGRVLKVWQSEDF